MPFIFRHASAYSTYPKYPGQSVDNHALQGHVLPSALDMVSDIEVDMVADMEVDKVADTVTDMVADKKQKNGRHGVRHGGRHGSTLHSHYIHTTFTLEEISQKRIVHRNGFLG